MPLHSAGGMPPPAEPASAVPPSPRAVKLSELARRHPVLGDLREYLALRRAVSRGDLEGARASVERLERRWPESIWRGSAYLVVGRLERRRGNLEAAHSRLAAAVEALRERAARDMARLLLAEVTAERGARPAALDLVQRLRETRPRGLVARRARRLAARLQAAGGSVTPAERLAEGELRLAEGDPEGALSQAAGALATTDDAGHRHRARWLEARARRALGDRERAEAIALALAEEGDAVYGPKALGVVARWKWNGDDDVAAAGLYGELLHRWPESEETAEALYALGRIRQDGGDHDGAFAAYMTLAERFPLLRLADEARWRAGWVRYLAGDDAEAARIFAALAIDCDRRTRVAAEYWEARALERLGTPEAASKLRHVAERHGATYYGALARARLGRADPRQGAPPAIRRPAFPDDLEGPHAERARILHRAGYDHLAHLELDAAAAENPAEPLLQAYAAIEAPGAIIRLARTRDAGRRWLYPLGYWDLVRRQAETVGLDPLLVTAVIRQESAFVPEAVSPARAHGLMQLLPRTAQEVAALAGMQPPDGHALAQPATNVALGTTLLRRLLDRYGGSQVKALAAYNAGEEAVAKWERRYGGRPEDEFVELISYRETREYVKAVLEHYAVYRALYAASPSATSAGSPPKAPFDMITMTSPGTAEATR